MKLRFRAECSNEWGKRYLYSEEYKSLAHFFCEVEVPATDYHLWTGQKDMNGNKIYEKDTVEFQYITSEHISDSKYVGQILWSDRYSSFIIPIGKKTTMNISSITILRVVDGETEHKYP